MNAKNLKKHPDQESEAKEIDWEEKYYNERFFWAEQARQAKEAAEDVFRSFAAVQKVLEMMLASLADNYGTDGCIFLPDPDPEKKAAFKRVEGGYTIEIMGRGE